MPKLLLSATILTLTALLTACGGSETTKSVTVPVNDTQNGKDYSFSYVTTKDFQAQIMPVSQMSVLEQQVFAAINEARQAGGSCYNPVTGQYTKNPKVNPLILEAHIYQAAKQHAHSMVVNNYATHIDNTDKTNETPAKRMVNAGYKPLAPDSSKTGTNLYFEESLAFGFQTPQSVVDAWAEKDEYQSYDHCMTLYTPLTYGAVAVEDGTSKNQYPRYWVLNISGVK